jgi:serine phosphatase RsbU (regulator of sigma subunit)
MTGVEGSLGFLLDRSHLLAPHDLPAAVAEGARRLGALDAFVYLVDRDQARLVPFGERDRAVVAVEGSVPGRAYKTLEVLPSAVDDQPRLWLPLLDGAERLGVLELLCSAEQVEEIRREAQLYASLVAELLRSRSQHTDLIARTRESRPMTLAAQLLWRQLPPFTYSTEHVTVTGLLEPWGEAAGDAFDHADDGAVLHAAVLDGMGHGLSATLMTSVALAAYRISRRYGADLVETAAAMDAAVAAEFGESSFVTALLVQLDLSTGTVTLLLAGHPAPLLLRAGKVLGAVDVAAGVPLGLGGRDDVVGEFRLQPGDALLMFTDGLVEARAPDGEQFGVHRLADFLSRESAAQQPPPETLRRLFRAVLDHQDEALQDDATCLMVEWATGRQREFDLGAKTT